MRQCDFLLESSWCRSLSWHSLYALEPLRLGLETLKFKNFGLKLLLIQSNAQVFAPLQHVKSSKCNPLGPKVNRDDFEILGYEKDPFLLKVKESILIKKEHPAINGTVTSVPIYLF